jgi:hypothetical protein
MAKGWLAMTIPDKPKSRLQRYQITEEGKKWLLGATKQSPHLNIIVPKLSPKKLNSII